MSTSETNDDRSPRSSWQRPRLKKEMRESCAAVEYRGCQVRNMPAVTWRKEGEDDKSDGT